MALVKLTDEMNKVFCGMSTKLSAIPLETEKNSILLYYRRFGEWTIVKKLDEGGFGQVYRVENNIRKGQLAALKAEPNDVEGGSAIKLESKGKWTARRARGSAEFRGTLRYCSPNVHEKKEQGRRDDLWSLFYVLIELHCGLPWQTIRDKVKVVSLSEIIL
uniref:Protein kinase domain-containing protein n=1 Tax=Heterorhabditis bacteriophora TaxID=37862 RepID=A0A1I7X9X9_HETBA